MRSHSNRLRLCHHDCQPWLSGTKLSLEVTGLVVWVEICVPAVSSGCSWQERREGSAWWCEQVKNRKTERSTMRLVIMIIEKRNRCFVKGKEVILTARLVIWVSNDRCLAHAAELLSINYIDCVMSFSPCCWCLPRIASVCDVSSQLSIWPGPLNSSHQASFHRSGLHS